MCYNKFVSWNVPFHLSFHGVSTRLSIVKNLKLYMEGMMPIAGLIVKGIVFLSKEVEVTVHTG